MSNSSDNQPVAKPPGIGEELFPLLLRVLDGLAHEWAAMGGEITRVGNVVSDIADKLQDDASVMELQSFDILSQNANAQAKLIGNISQLLGGGGGSAAEVLDLMEHMPLPDVRRRLQQSIGMTPSAIPADWTTTISG